MYVLRSRVGVPTKVDQQSPILCLLIYLFIFIALDWFHVYIFGHVMNMIHHYVITSNVVIVVSLCPAIVLLNKFVP